MAIKKDLLKSAAFIKSILEDSKPVEASEAAIVAQNPGVNFNDPNETFKYDPISYPLKSTQQLKVDWSKFENHTFFSSAEAKVNEAFDQLINRFPFDGSKSEVDKFLNSLTGYEKWIFDQFPGWSGALHFSGTQTGEPGINGAWISVKDKSGYLYPEISRNSSGETIINQNVSSSFSIEAQLYLPSVVNGTQVIFQKQSSNVDGFTLYLSTSTSTTSATAIFSICSGSTRASVSASLKKGSYNHICLVMDRDNIKPLTSLQFFHNQKLIEQSNYINIGKFTTDNSDFVIGSGSSFYSNSTLVTPNQTLSGTMDELRIFHSIRDLSQQKLYATRGIYSTPDLKLYYRFNEPPPLLSENDESESVNSIVLDSSGNSLHAQINNFTGSLRVNAKNDPYNPIKNEKKEFSIVLFPAYSEVKTLNANLLVSASLYDAANPNFIVNLVPKHYFLEAASDGGFFNQYGNIGDQYGGSGIPGEGKLGSTHLMLTFLYIWAKFFDDIKMYVDSFGTLKTIGYDEDTVPDNFLNDIVKSYGFYIPTFFNHANLLNYSDDSDGETTDYSSGISFKNVNAQILRRLILNLSDIVQSKGTIHSIKSFLRSVGIDPDNSLKIREYGGPTTKLLGSSRNKKQEPIASVNLLSSSFLISAPLSASRVEPGFPLISGSFIKDSLNRVIGTTVPSDGLLTSGSWTVECSYKFPRNKLDPLNLELSTQSLMRLIVTGSDAYSEPGLITNVIANQRSETTLSKVKAYIRPGVSVTSPTLELSLDLPDLGIFDGERWNVSIGRKRNDEFEGNYLSSSYYLRVGKSNGGELDEVYTTSKFFCEKSSNESNVFEVLSGSFNASGSFICFGEQSFPQSILHPFLNNTSENPSEARTTTLNTLASNLRFWSKSIDETEWKEHIRNYKSSGVNDPKINYNFVTTATGSFNKLRMDTLTKQPIRDADGLGNIIFVDHSHNNLVISGTLFDSGSKAVVVGDIASYSFLSPDFDESATDEKVRIRGLTYLQNIDDNPYATLGPSYASNEGFVREEPVDDTRLSIEFSLADAVDRDIVNMFSTFDALSDALGKPENMFASDYPELNILREVYFNRHVDNLNFRNFLEFFRWFDASITSFIQQLIPGKTRFKGTNFVIESHMLERHKRESRHSENYLGSKSGFAPNANKLFIINELIGNIK